MHLFCALLALPLSIRVPANDVRNTQTPDPHTHFAAPRYESPAEWSARRERLRKQILAAAGLLPMPERTPLRPRVVRRLERGEYAIETVLLETLPGYYVGGNLYRPLGRSGPFPGVLVPHGHWKRGRLEHREDYSVPALGINLARQGYVAFAWDMVGYNDTRQTPHDFGGWREQLWSFNPLGLQLWNSIRALDFLESHPAVDARRIGATGASGGATQTFLLSAVDERVRASAPVNMISATMQGGDPCEEAPGLRVGTSNVEIAALMAPRPMLVVSASGDWTRNTPREEFPAIARIYQLEGAPSQVENVHLQAEHNYNGDSREAVYAFLARHLQGRATACTDAPVRPEPDELLLAMPGGRLPAGALDYGELFAQWRAAARRQAHLVDRRTLREVLRYTLGVEWPAQVTSETGGDRVLLSRTDRHDRVPGIWLPGRGTDAAVVVRPNGAAAARATPEADALLHSGRSVLLIDAFQSGAAEAPRDRYGKYFHSYNRTDDANRVQDILTALAFMRSQTDGRVRLVGFGQAAIWCTFAAAVAPADIELSAPLGAFRGTDEDFRDHFFVPGIQRAGGLEAALRLLHSRRHTPQTLTRR